MKKNNLLNIVWKVIKTILKWLTSPIWFPWKVLFIRKEEKKFKNVSAGTKIFRLLRSPITKTLKFLVFILILLVELSIVYKVMNFITAPLVRANVQEFYLDEDVDAYNDMFDVIDEQEMVVKNNFYSILDSDVVKTSLTNIDDDAELYLIQSFNEDDIFQEAILYNVENLNEVIPNIIESYDDNLDNAPLFLIPVVADTNMILDSIDGVFNILIEEEGTDIFNEIDINSAEVLVNAMKYYHQNDYDFSVSLLVNDDNTVTPN